MLAVEWHADTEPHFSFGNLGRAPWAVGLPAAGSASRCDIDLVPCSVDDVSAIAFGHFSQLSVQPFELFVDNAVILES
jgi:hypothetical protein